MGSLGTFTVLADSSIGNPFGYLGLLAATMVEALFPPAAGPVLPLAGLAVASGQASYLAAVAVATLGSTLGGLVVFFASRAIGESRIRRFLVRHSRGSATPDRLFTRSEKWFEDHADLAVLFGRCVPIVRSLVSIPAGLQGMTWHRFLLLTIVGNTMWSSALIGGAALLGGQWSTVSQWSRPIEVAGLIWVVIVVLLLYRAARPGPGAGVAPEQ